MVSLMLTQATFWLCAALFLRLFTYRRQGARFRRGISWVAVLVMGCAGATMLQILQGSLRLPIQAWPLVFLLCVFSAAVVRSGGNLAGVMRPEPPSVWTGPDRRKGSR